ncbi:MAG: ABC transporter substrate-binding protein [Burkholderiales bacterium RIFCSPHIGHO2_12_FULL_69_20]|nr:MAG: ABC transporter substrate-binding protein [Burkholderiales bacterium RIFCSPHIGHO2_12_FULL_69_20]
MLLAASGGLATLAAPALLGCSRKADGPLRLWAMGREGEVVGALLADFHRAHPSITVRVDTLPWSAAHEKLLTAFAGDATPDLAQLGNSWMPEFAALGALAPLDAFVAATPALQPSDWFEGIWSTNVVDGQLLGLPWYVDTRLLFYRRDLFERAGFAQPPASWSSWVAALDALQKTGIAHPLLLPLNEFEPLLALALQQGDPLLREGGRWGNFRSAGFQRALGFFLARFSSGHAAAVTNQQIANLWQEFGRGTFAAYISGPWNIGELDRRLGLARRADWATAPLPAPDGSGPGPGASTAGGASLVVFKRSQRQADAQTLLAWLAQPAVQQRFHAMTGNLPPRRSTWQLAGADGMPLAQDDKTRAFGTQLERVRPAPAVPEWERIAQEMQQLAQRAVAERQSPLTMATTLDARVDGFLEKRRWMLDRRERPVAQGGGMTRRAAA